MITKPKRGRPRLYNGLTAKEIDLEISINNLARTVAILADKYFKDKENLAKFKEWQKKRGEANAS